MSNLLTFLINNISDDKTLKIESKEDQNQINFTITTANNNLAIIIGKNGKVINAIRTILKGYFRQQDKEATVTLLPKT